MLRESALRDLARREVAAWTARVRALRVGHDQSLQEVLPPARLSLVQGEFEIISGPSEGPVLSAASRRARGRSLDD
jgi:hypothetical protein